MMHWGAIAHGSRDTGGQKLQIECLEVKVRKILETNAPRSFRTGDLRMTGSIQ